MEWRDHIECHPEIMLGKPVFKGTRITVELVLEKIADGVTVEELLRSYPRLRPKHIRAAFAFSVDRVSGR